MTPTQRSVPSFDHEWTRMRAFASYKGHCQCGWRGPARYYPWEAQSDEAAHLAVCAIVNLDLRQCQT